MPDLVPSPAIGIPDMGCGWTVWFIQSLPTTWMVQAFTVPFCLRAFTRPFGFCLPPLPTIQITLFLLSFTAILPAWFYATALVPYPAADCSETTDHYLAANNLPIALLTPTGIYILVRDSPSLLLPFYNDSVTATKAHMVSRIVLVLLPRCTGRRHGCCRGRVPR